MVTYYIFLNKILILHKVGRGALESNVILEELGLIMNPEALRLCLLFIVV
jgi:hypothetical protein